MSDSFEGQGGEVRYSGPPPPRPPEPGLVHVPSTVAGPLDSEVLVTIGDIACTRTQLMTPNGVFPLVGTNWIVTNNTTTREKIPTYAIVLAIIFVLRACLVCSSFS